MAEQIITRDYGLPETPMMRLLLAAVLPRRTFDRDEALALLHYVQRRNAVAAAAHRERQEACMVDRERIVTVHAP